MTNTSITQAGEREALQQQGRAQVDATRAQIFRRHQREELERERRRIAASATTQKERVVIARCPTCGEMLERAVFPMDSSQSGQDIK